MFKAYLRYDDYPWVNTLLLFFDPSLSCSFSVASFAEIRNTFSLLEGENKMVEMVLKEILPKCLVSVLRKYSKLLSSCRCLLMPRLLIALLESGPHHVDTTFT